MLDFANDADSIQAAFADYYRTTILAEETDPNKLHDLKADLDSTQVYDDTKVEELVRHYLAGAPREQLDPILDECVAVSQETPRLSKVLKLVAVRPTLYYHKNC